MTFSVLIQNNVTSYSICYISKQPVHLMRIKSQNSVHLHSSQGFGTKFVYEKLATMILCLSALFFYIFT